MMLKVNRVKSLVIFKTLFIWIALAKCYIFTRPHPPARRLRVLDEPPTSICGRERCGSLDGLNLDPAIRLYHCHSTLCSLQVALQSFYRTCNLRLFAALGNKMLMM